MTLNNKRANADAGVRRRKKYAERTADNDQKPAGKVVGAYGVRKRNTTTVGITLAHITKGRD